MRHYADTEENNLELGMLRYYANMEKTEIELYIKVKQCHICGGIGDHTCDCGAQINLRDPNYKGVLHYIPHNREDDNK